jgi:Flp pilus assembly pilin Flp
MTKLIARLKLRGDRGAATVDMGLAAVFTGIALVAAITLIGGDITSW